MIKEGDLLPEHTFKILTQEGVKDLPSDKLFGGKRVVLFGVPGAFTPTCSSKHLPGFIQKSADLRAHGIDSVACLAVNDAYVMAAWGNVNRTDGRILMLADGDAEFVRKTGLEWDTGDKRMGVRSKRFAMVVEDGRVTRLLVDRPGAFEVSSAENVLKSLASNPATP